MGKFTRVVEDFACEKCGFVTKGTGYTNHCPKCLWSKHVDINPGDRAAECGGMMKPIGIEVDKDGYIILHKCVTCGHIKKNTSAPEDDYEEILKMSVGKV